MPTILKNIAHSKQATGLCGGLYGQAYLLDEPNKASTEAGLVKLRKLYYVE